MKYIEVGKSWFKREGKSAFVVIKVNFINNGFKSIGSTSITHEITPYGDVEKYFITHRRLTIL